MKPAVTALRLILCTSLLLPTWARAVDGLHEISGIDENLPTHDLQVLDPLVGNASIVALGESTHASGGFYQAKFRLIRYLVEEKGFRAIGIEDGWGATDKISEYVQTCNGDVYQAISPLYPIWQDKSMVKLLQFLCDFNRKHSEDPVHFYGFDIQDPFHDRSHLRRLVRENAPRLENRLMIPLQQCLGLKHETKREWWTVGDAASYFSGKKKVSKKEYRACLNAISKFRNFAHSAGELGTKKFRSWALLSLKALEGWEGQMFRWGTQNPYTPRDEAMAYALTEIRRLRFPKAKTIIWAHNGHIMMDGGNVVGWKAKMMGSFLREKLGANYVPIGLTGYKLETYWPHQTVPNPEIPTSPDSVEVMIHHQTGYDYALLDLSGAFLKWGKQYYIQGPDKSYFQIPKDQFRALFYLGYSAPMEYVGP